LRARKRGLDLTDEEKWVSIYQTIFPEEEPASFPSPYYQPEEMTKSSATTISTSASSNLSDYKDYLLKPLDETKQQTLGLKFCQKLGISDPSICQMMARTLREVQLEDLQQFDSDRITLPDLSTRFGVGDEEADLDVLATVP